MSERRLATATALVLFVLLGAVTASLGATLPALRATYHVGATSGGRLVSLYMLGSLIAVLTGGLGETKLQPTITITTLTGLFAGGCLGIGLAPNWTILQIAAVGAGAGFGGLALFINTAFAKAFDGQNLMMLNVLNAAFGFGAVAGPIGAGLLAPKSVQLLFLACGVLAIGCLPVRRWGIALARPSGPADPSDGRGRAALKIVVPFAVISFFYEGLETSTGTWESTHLAWIGFSASAAAQISACYWAGLFAGRLIIPIFTSRKSLPAIASGGVLAATIALSLASLRGFTPYAYALAGFGLAPVFPAVITWIAKTAPAPQFANAVLLSAGMIGGVTWPSLVGLAANPGMPATIALSLAGIGVLCLAAVRIASSRPVPDNPDHIPNHCSAP
jgi:fucose permease